MPEHIAVADGGHIRGAGTSTSDSIPAMLSDGEYVVKADAVKRIGVDKLDAINAGHYADGGKVKPPDLRGDLSVTYDPTSGGAYINGTLHPPGDPLLSVPEIAQAIARSKADADVKQPQKQKYHSDFINDSGRPYGGDFADGGIVGHFAEGGQVGSSSSPVTRFQEYVSQHFANGGILDLPHLAIGGMPDFPSAHVSEALGSLDKSSTSGERHLIDLRTDHGIVPNLRANDATLSQLRQQALMKANVRTGKSQSWNT